MLVCILRSYIWSDSHHLKFRFRCHARSSCSRFRRLLCPESSGCFILVHGESIASKRNWSRNPRNNSKPAKLNSKPAKLNSKPAKLNWKPARLNSIFNSIRYMQDLITSHAPLLYEKKDSRVNRWSKYLSRWTAFWDWSHGSEFDRGYEAGAGSERGGGVELHAV